MKTILFINHTASRGGASLSLLELIKKTRNPRWQPLVALPSAGPLTELLEEEGIKHRILPIFQFHHTSQSKTPLHLRSLFGLIRSARAHFKAIRAVIQEVKPAAIWINSSVLLLTGLVAKQMHIPVVWCVREIISEKPRFIKVILSRLIHLCSSKIICVSDMARRQFNGTSLHGYYQIIYPWLDEKHFTPRMKDETILKRLGLQHKDTVLGIMGLIHVTKGHASLTRAIFMIADKIPHLKVLVVGSGSLNGERGDPVQVRSLKNMIHALKLDDRFIFVGDQKHIPDVLSILDGLILPSICPDAMPRSVLEAMAMAKPVIVSQWAGSTELVDHGISGLIIDPNHPRQIASAILRLFTEPSKARAMGLEAHRRLSEYFSSSQKEDILEVIRIFDKVGPQK